MTGVADRASLLWAVQGHVPAMAALHSKLFASPWDEAAIATLIGHPGSVAMVASLGKPTEICGFVLAQAAADEAEILTIGVAPNGQRQGIGKKLVEGLKRAAGRAGAKSLFLEVAESNSAARALYAKTGFHEAGRRKGYYTKTDGSKEDALLLKCEV
ncbi:MAG: ribosomal protein S18-alanine N-acetyltransferase [Proteobacteria bacterium]|nr:ribosomal protein S18-alanine N-acetyltransferase [Pseudomonadota bacterium]